MAEALRRLGREGVEWTFTAPALANGQQRFVIHFKEADFGRELLSVFLGTLAQ